MDKKQIKIGIYSEFNKLKTVILHRPSKEFKNLLPYENKKNLIEDIPYLPTLIKEWNVLYKIYENHGINVLVFSDLLTEALDVLDQSNEKINILNKYINANKVPEKYCDKLIDFLSTQTNKDIADYLISGIRKTTLGFYEDVYAKDFNPLVIPALPNLIFQRDPYEIIGNTIVINSMHYNVRVNETFLVEIIFTNHPYFEGYNIIKINKDCEGKLEGGDVLVLNNETVLIGLGERSELSAAKYLAKKLFSQANNHFKNVITIPMPDIRAAMHLDTIFANIGKNTFLLNSSKFEHMIKTGKPAFVFKITKTDVKKIELPKENATSFLQNILEKLINNKVEVITGSSKIHFIDEQIEQWNDGFNFFAINNKVVVGFERNVHIKKLLTEKNIQVLTIPSSELGKLRGGIRCMSMPILRENK